MTLVGPADRRTALVVGAALVGLTATVAAIASLWDPAAARDSLDLTFPGIPREASEAGSILRNNLRLLGATLAACLVLQLVRPTRGALDALPARVLIALCDTVLIAAAAAHALVVGMGIGGYGGRMIASLLPHGPFELAAFGLALALYVAARREALVLPRALGVAGTAATLLVVGAVVEVYLPLS